MKSKWINLILFQLLWIACVFGVAHEQMLPALLVISAMVIYHSLPSVRKVGDVALVVASLLMGFVLDSVLAYWNMIDYHHDLGYDRIAPYWIMILWLGFGLSLNHSFSWMFDKLILALFFVAVGPVLSYLSASRIGAIDINNTAITLIVASVMWLLLFSILFLIRNSKVIRGAYAYR